ncbi:MAG: glycerol dehydrogenase [Pseudoflavonifractor sp.]
MAMLEHSTRAWGSPSRYIQGRYELENVKTHTDIYGKKIFFLIDVFFFKEYQAKFDAIYRDSDCRILCEQFGGQCTEGEILRCTDLAKDLNPDVVVGIGGGKTMDTAKAVADNYAAAVIIVPTTASTDAPAMGLSVVYTEAGEHIGARHYKKNPDLVLLDTDVIAKAPVRFIVAGMGDALATYPECRANLQSCSPNYVNAGYHQTLAGLAISEACHETILSKGVSAKLAAEQGLCTKDVEDIIEANTLLSGLGVQNTSCAGAHSIAEGITVLPPCAKLLHGEVVAFGVLVELIVEGAPAEELDQLYAFFEAVGLPTTFEDLGIKDATDADIMKVAETSMHSYWDVEPFTVNPRMVFDGMRMANILGMQRK